MTPMEISKKLLWPSMLEAKKRRPKRRVWMRSVTETLLVLTFFRTSLLQRTRTRSVGARLVPSALLDRSNASVSALRMTLKLDQKTQVYQRMALHRNMNCQPILGPMGKWWRTRSTQSVQTISGIDAYLRLSALRYHSLSSL